MYVKFKKYDKNSRNRDRKRGRNRLRSCEIICAVVAVIQIKLTNLVV
jgi:hypothetical protein